MSSGEALARLCTLAGIGLEYWDVRGVRRTPSEASLRAILAAMDLPAQDDAAVAESVARAEHARAAAALPPVVTARVGEPLRVSPAGSVGRWRLTLEDGGVREGDFDRDEVCLGDDLPLGYHRLAVQSPAGAPAREVRVIVAPGACHLPAALDGEGRGWGLAAQLYGLRSARNWGIGDFSDLRQLVEFAAPRGACAIGLNPLHAVDLREGSDASPYSPVDRRFLNPLYIDVEALPEYAHSTAMRALVGAQAFQARLRALRAAQLVDYDGVVAAKRPAFALAWRHFRDQDGTAGAERHAAFGAWRQAQGVPLRRFALGQALREHFLRQDPGLWGWPVWPQAYRRPDSPEVAAFERDHADEIGLVEYLQWQADEQLGAAARRARELGMAVGLYRDMALGCAQDATETWSEPGLFANGVHAGAPPDDFNMAGQDWGLPPWRPERLRASGYEAFAELLRSNMRHAGAVRIDHVMSMMRLFWIPHGAGAAAGAYVAYPLEEMLAVLALESVRAGCMVIGEDLGTVPDEVRAALGRVRALSCRPMLFQREHDGSFASPEAYPREALTSIGTHDMPTLRGFWRGTDLDARMALGLLAEEGGARDAEIVGRAQDRARLLLALDRAGLLPEGTGLHPVAVPDLGAALNRAVHAFVARTPSRLLLVQAEDLFGQEEQVNLPGTTSRQHPNWRRKLPLDLGEWGRVDDVAALLEVVAAARPAEPAVQPAAEPEPPAVRIPRATYRLQFSRRFTFEQAESLLPFLDALGVSHVYASPLLRARPGSEHGYDIIDHAQINPEIGGRAGFDRFVRALHRRGMGLVLDIVPNHMGVMGDDNAWWLDVLENGPASQYADFFDIDWQIYDEALRGRLLVPVLGDHYGRVLESGELTLSFDAERGELSLRYHEHRFPVDPREYPEVLGGCAPELAARLGTDNPLCNDYESLMTAFRHLPPRSATDGDSRAERARDKEVHKRRLAALCREVPDIAAFVEERLAAFRAGPADPAATDRLHDLLEAQAYRLSNWRVAADDINYRRFFDINQLAGLRMERPEVFERTHRLVLDLVAQGSVDGLRIDHPDGLHDPLDYYRRLQARGGEPAGNRPPSVYLVIEKIAADHERLPEDWPVHGTTGYGFANLVNGLYVDTGARTRLDRVWRNFTGDAEDFGALVLRSKKLIMRTALASELNVLASQLRRIARADRRTRDFTLNSLRDALADVVACFPVYRTYVRHLVAGPEDERYVDWAVSVARKMSRAADVSVFDFVREVLLGRAAEGHDESMRARIDAFSMRFQQYTGPVMAKGLEDTALYNHNRLVSLNEVGGNPERFGVTVPAFHGAMTERARRRPHAMLATSTHDSKRSEDVRARIDVLSEVPAAWRLRLQRWRRLNRSRKTEVDGLRAPSPNDEYLLYQTLVGVWPLEDPDDAGLVQIADRVEAYMLKAAREAKAHTSWIHPDPGYERALSAFVRGLLDGARRNLFLEDFLPFQRQVARIGLWNALSQTLVKLTAPGVPDIYQGNATWQFRLVDPDNRDPVDHAWAAEALLAIEDAWSAPGADPERCLADLTEAAHDGRLKLLLTWRVLQFRRERPQLFELGTYQPLAVEGAHAEHLVAYARVHDRTAAVVLAPRLLGRLLGESQAPPCGPGAWGDTRVELPEGEWSWTDAIAGGPVSVQGRQVEAATALARFPGALLAGVRR